MGSIKHVLDSQNRVAGEVYGLVQGFRNIFKVAPKWSYKTYPLIIIFNDIGTQDEKTGSEFTILNITYRLLVIKLLAFNSS